MTQAPSHARSATALDELCINTLRFLSVDAVQKANSGHPGLPLGAAPMAYVLWTHYLKHHPANPHWLNRDRFVLSAGHGSMLLYSLLHMTGYELSLGEIEQFRQWGSRTPGHPERGLTPGVETTTGPLGQGFGNASAWPWRKCIWPRATTVPDCGRATDRFVWPPLVSVPRWSVDRMAPATPAC